MIAQALKLLILGLVVGSAIVPGGADAAVFRVALDGSGDYTVVQDAVEAAASGDTISIAPGEYLVSDVGAEVEAIAFVRSGELTFLGDDRDTVTLGLPAPVPDQERGPDGIAASQGVLMTVRNVTLRNVSNGILSDGDRLVVSDCNFVGNFQGIDSAARFQTDVRRCLFEKQDDIGLAVVNVLGGTGVFVDDCEFNDNGVGMDLQVLGSIVNACDFRGGVVGFQVSFGGSVTLTNCVFADHENLAVSIVGGSTAHLVDNMITPPMAGSIFVVGALSGWGNSLGGGSYATLTLSPSTVLDFHNNHILNDGGWSVHVGGGLLPVRTFDLTDNYWGTNDANQIAAWIHDYNDDPLTRILIDYDPFWADPVATEETSFGGLKSRYAPQN